MAHKFRETTPVTGDIIAAEDIMRNFGALLAEFNGNLDADNIPEKAISSAMIEQGAFTLLESHSSTTPVAFSGETTEWTSENGSGTELHDLTITTPVDAMLLVIWSATWSRAALLDNDSIAFRVLVNGAVVGQSQRYARLRPYDSGMVFGLAPVQGGTHTLTVEVRQWLAASDAASGATDTINARELIALAFLR